MITGAELDPSKTRPRLQDYLQSHLGRAIDECVLRADKALLRGDAAVALREIDRGWRLQEDNAGLLAPIYGRLLAYCGSDHVAALNMLDRALSLGPDPELEALRIRSLLHLHRLGDTTRQLLQALAAYAVEPGDPLAAAAGAMLLDPRVDGAAGWVGLTRRRAFIGQLRGELDPGDLSIDAGGVTLTGEIRTRYLSGERYFLFVPPEQIRASRFQFNAGGMPLLGSGRTATPEFALDGRTECVRGVITGWARVGWAPLFPLRLKIQDDIGNSLRVRSISAGPAYQRRTFRVELYSSGLRGGRFRISARLPDGREDMLPDTPLLLRSAVQLPRQADSTSHRRRVQRASQESDVDVIVPVYGAKADTLACLRTLLPTLDDHSHAIVVDDASDDHELASALDQLAARNEITLLRNNSNLGFVASVNRAMALHQRNDAVLLNSDTRVAGDWLHRLRRAAYSHYRVGTVTPFASNSSITSYPADSGQSLAADDTASLHALVAAANPGGTAQIPVGVGCCIYLRRDCLEDVGTFDVDVFGKGYGEETDFCLRARARGWQHLLAADVFVYHSGARSFGTRRAALLDRSQRLLRLRHSGFDRLVKDFLDSDPLHNWRRRLDETRLGSFQGTFVLVLTLALPGGVDRFVNERCHTLGSQGLCPLILRPTVAQKTNIFELWSATPSGLGDLRYSVPGDLTRIRALLGSLRIAHVEIQHFLKLDPRVVEIAMGLRRPYDVYLHDYVWICPRVTLIDGSGSYCHEPAVSVCEACVRKNGSYLGHSISVAALRTRSLRWLRGARSVIAPTRDVANRYERHFPGLVLQTRVYGDALPATPPVCSSSASGVVRVAVVGAIGEHKGYHVLLACAKDAAKRRLPLHYVVIGYTHNDARLINTGRVFVTGRYSESEAPYLLRREQGMVAFVPSVWPETWCYSLDYLVGAGLPVVAFDLGAIPERMRTAGRLGVFLPLQTTPRAINDELLKLAQSTREEVPAVDNKNSSTSTDAGALNAAAQLLPLPAGLYLFSVQSAAPRSEETAGNLTLPAIHVGLGPGVQSGQVEFLSGPSTDGGWLFARDNQLVVRIGNGGANLLLTSMRAPGGAMLSVKVEHLDQRVADALRSSPPLLAGEALGNGPAQSPGAGANGEVPVQVTAHIRTLGDQVFAAVPWAGRKGPGLWIESFAVKAMAQLEAGDIEYKSLTATGFETPWMSQQEMCGTKGMSVPLIGFAVRLRPGPRTTGYACEYSGYFESGAVVGPVRNGTPCRSARANDALEGLQVSILKSGGRPLIRKTAQTGDPERPGSTPAASTAADAPARKLAGSKKRSLKSRATSLEPPDRSRRASHQGGRAIRRSHGRKT